MSETQMNEIQTNNIFQPLQFGRFKLNNRIVMAPMTRNKSPKGVPGANVAAYYRSRAAGGVGLIITEGTYIGHPAANGYADVPAFHGEQALAGWKNVVEAVHAAGGLIIPQIWHVGAARSPGVEPDPAVPGYGPMQVENDGQLVVKAMTKADIADAINAYAEAAANAEEIGFDGVEIHGAHGYLIDQFLWEGSNQRSDEYGGTLENRSRFALEVVKAVRARVSADFPVVFRFSQWKLGDYNARIANSPEELAQLLKPLADAGVDFFHASTRRLWQPAFEGSNDTLATWTRKLTGKPVIAVGSVGLEKEFRVGHFTREESPDTAIHIDVKQLSDGIEHHLFDMVAVGRALLADPNWTNKLKEGRITDLIGFDAKALDELVV
jgi:2,4-dienoyl-CoA reductase-like NADH-dependent reductase (Old Yellow Enzyme family)